MTQSLRIALAALLALPLPALAESYEEAQAGLAAAYNDYYKALRSKPGFTQSDAQNLATQILSPANAKVAKAMEEDSKRVRKQSEEKGSDVAGSGLSPAPKPSRTPASILVETPPKEEVVLDGSNVPKEVEFPGRKK